VKRFACLLALAACGEDAVGSANDTTSEDGESTAQPSTTTSSTTTTTTTTTTTMDSSGVEPSTTDGGESSTGEDPPDGEVLEVRFLGVGGFSIRHGGDLILTAPMYSNPAVLEVQFGSIAPNPARIEAFLDPMFVEDTAAILSGHAHYDHLLDVPYVWGMTDHAVVFGNTSVAAIMIAAGLPEASIVALDDAAMPLVDRRNCDEPDMCTGVPAGNEGAWVAVPQSNVRVRALCSSHPAQVLGVIHFGEGCVEGQPKTPPESADEWREGATLAYLVDFLDPDSGEIVFRVFVQDAPTDAPVGHPPAELLDEKRVDLALLNIGSWENVEDHPGAIIAAIEPRYVIGGHWEDFFRAQDEPIMPLPFSAPPEDFDMAAIAAIGDESDLVVIVDGEQQDARYFRPVPQTDFEIYQSR
jgi:L-ascorbate metabolism protein UlaG (beta-lactamase superfamily)